MKQFEKKYQCRAGCGACCIELSISTPMPGYPQGKPAGESCLHLDEHFQCRLFNDSRRPQVCRDLKPMPEMCRNSQTEALEYLRFLEKATS